MKNKYIALYCRTSTSHQTKGLESQERILRKYCKQNNISNYKVYSDHNVSGKLSSRPKLDELLSAVKNEEVTKIITPNLSRISRSLKNLLEIVELLQNHGVEFISLSESFSINSMHGRLMISILGAVSQLEREMIAEKTRIGLMNAREKGLVLGRKRELSHEKIIETAKVTDLSVRAIAKLHGCSPSSVSRILKRSKEEPCKG